MSLFALLQELVQLELHVLESLFDVNVQRSHGLQTFGAMQLDSILQEMDLTLETGDELLNKIRLQRIAIDILCDFRIVFTISSSDK